MGQISRFPAPGFRPLTQQLFNRFSQIDKHTDKVFRFGQDERAFKGRQGRSRIATHLVRNGLKRQDFDDAAHPLGGFCRLEQTFQKSPRPRRVTLDNQLARSNCSSTAWAGWREAESGRTWATPDPPDINCQSPSTASQSGPHRRSRMAVWSRNVWM
jgi:hypothetical protein